MLLQKDGYLAQFATYRFGSYSISLDDTDDGFKFGDISSMNTFSKEKSLGLILIESNIPPDSTQVVYLAKDVKNLSFLLQQRPVF